MILDEIPFDLIESAERGDRGALAKLDALNRRHDALVKWDRHDDGITPPPPPERPDIA